MVKAHKPIFWLIVVAVFSFLVIKANFTFLQIFFFLKKNPTLIFLTVTSCIAYLSWGSQRHLTRAKHTMDFQVSFSDSEVMRKAAKTFHVKLCKMTSAEIVALAVERKPTKEHDRVVQILNAWERVAVALKHDVYDEEMLYDIYGTLLLKLCSTLNPFIQQRQSANAKVFVNLKWLYLRWKVRREQEFLRLGAGG
ncbi:DUF4760 domain-containing protein [Pseudomonas sp. App30]|uniref:DUF4760 domain-containing protein n=1 Tax=Pseudomonas sp. App30 TaxID=3068990 RepID=UPI003A80A108